MVVSIPFDVKMLDNDNNEKKKAVIFSKHLCGPATDMTLRCVAKSQEKEGKSHLTFINVRTLSVFSYDCTVLSSPVLLELNC